VRARQSGFSLIEFLAVAFLATLLLMFVLQRGESAEAALRPAAFTAELRTWMERARAQAGLDFRQYDIVGALSLAPAGWKNPTAPITVRHPYGGPVTLQVIAWRGVANKALRWRADAIPQQACGLIAQELGGPAATLSVNGTALKAQPQEEFTLSAAQTACGTAANTILWTQL
jgi:hypothetical protein